MPGRPDPPVSGAFTFSCILKASSASSLEQLEQIFNSHGEEIVKEEGGAKSFSLTSSADGQYVRIEEFYDGEHSGRDFEDVHVKDGTHWWHFVMQEENLVVGPPEAVIWLAAKPGYHPRDPKNKNF